MLTFEKKRDKYDSRESIRIIDHSNHDLTSFIYVAFNMHRIINWNSIPQEGKCKVYIKSDSLPGNYTTVVDPILNCVLCWNHNLKVYIEVIE